jgi:NTE family protein
MKALVLSGGGARGAYQAGVLTAVAEIVSKHNIQIPFQIYTGVSAGAINVAYLAAGAHEFALTTKRLSAMWSDLHSEKVFKTDAVSLGKIGLSWVGELSFGGLTGGSHGKSLLDTTPLGDLLRNNINFNKIKENIEKGLLSSVAVTALDYKTSETITFVEGGPDTPQWNRSRRHSESTHLQAEHILASSAIPLLFTPGKVDERFFGDGCVRNVMPLSPALHLDATSLMIIGVRKVDQTAYEERVLRDNTAPSVARVMNVLLNSVLLDGIEVDIERLNRINNFLKAVPTEYHDNLNFKAVEHVWIHPSEDIGLIAASMASKLPRVIRYLLKGLGPLEDASEIISYLLFEPDFCKKLIDIGYNDGLQHQDQIAEFLLRK